MRVSSVIRRSVFLVCAISGAALAQKSDATSICWRPRPLAGCKSWVVTEAAVEAPISSTSTRHYLVGYPNGEAYVSNDFEARLAFSLGVMKNVDSSSAFGL